MIKNSPDLSNLSRFPKNRLLVIGLGIIAFFALVIAGYLAYQNINLKKSLLVNTCTRSESDNSGAKKIDPNNKGWKWKTYVNNRLGFEIEVPASIEGIDFSEKKKACDAEYDKKCQTGEIDGCGGGPRASNLIRFVLYGSEELVNTYCPYEIPGKYDVPFSISLYEGVSKETLFGSDKGDDNNVVSDFQFGEYSGKKRIHKYLPPYGLPYSFATYDFEKNGTVYSFVFSEKYAPELYGEWLDKIVSSIRFLHTTKLECNNLTRGFSSTLPNITWNCNSIEGTDKYDGGAQVEVRSPIFTITLRNYVEYPECETNKTLNCQSEKLYSNGLYALYLYKDNGKNIEIYGHYLKPEYQFSPGLSIKYKDMDKKELTNAERTELIQFVNSIKISKP